MKSDDVEVNEVKKSVFLDLATKGLNGYFAKRVRAGDRPSYVYPSNHLPKTTSGRMEIVTSYIAAGASQK